MPMIVIDIKKATEKTKGILSRCLSEIRPGLFVGSLSKRMIEQLWNVIVSSKPGSACLAYPVKNEFGVRVLSIGSSRCEMTDNFGLLLVSFVKNKVRNNKEIKK